MVRIVEIAARLTAKGQVTMPAAVRRVLDLEMGGVMIFEMDLGPGTPHAQVREAASREAAWSAQAERRGDPSD